MAEALLELVLKRATIKGRLTRGEGSILAQAVDGDAESFAKVSKFLERVEPSYDEFETVQTAIECLDRETDHEVEKAAFDALYYRVFAACETFISRNKPPSNPSTSTSTSNANSRIKLPTISIPTFSGAYQEWIPFRDTFKSLIHDNTGLSNVEKLQYLKSCLSGEAANTIKTLSITNVNYLIAWDTVTKQFGNTRLIIQNHLNALTDLKPVGKGTSSSLRELQNQVSTNLSVLKSLNLPTDQWDALVIHLMLPKLDFATRREWETKNEKDIPIMSEMLDFLKTRAQTLESLECARHIGKPDSAPAVARKPTYQRVSSHVAKTNSRSCPLCSNEHYINQCPTFLQLIPEERIKRVNSMRLCGNCLKAGHLANACTAGVCRTCSKRHNTLLHLPTRGVAVNNASLNAEAQPYAPAQTEQPRVVNASVSMDSPNQILLSTSLVLVTDRNGQDHQLRALIDSGSQSHFMTKGARERLKLPERAINVAVVGIGQRTNPIKHLTSAHLKSNNSPFSARISCLVVDSITESLPTRTFDAGPLKIPCELPLADPTFNRSAPVDMLIGAELFFEIQTGNMLHLGNGLPWLQETKLGWVIGGPVSSQINARSRTLTCNLATLDAQLEQFWKIEENHQISRETQYSTEEAACEQHFKDTTRRDETGRFEVELPFRTKGISMGDSRPMALKRLRAMEQRFKRNPDLREKYAAFMAEYEELGHMTLLPNDEVTNFTRYYLPHHAVFKTTETTAKIRIVFDGSCRPCNGQSLNETLMTGPIIQEDLSSILTRFRTHLYVFSCDIVKMYRQIKIAPAHRSHQLIFWRSNEQEPIETYQLNTVTYGLAPSSFLAVRCLKQLALEAESRFPQASKIICRDMFMDDMLTGSDSLEEAVQLKTDLTDVLSEAGFQLCKWAANHDSLLPKDGSANQSVVLNFDSQGDTKTLGQKWNCRSDCFTYDYKLAKKCKGMTKRSILSRIAQLYDPLGLLGPVIICGKLLLQKLWSEGVGWDEPVGATLSESFGEFDRNLSDLTSIKIPRRVTVDGKIKTRELHGFCDASERAYGACIFVKTVNNTGAVCSRLLCAKSRLAPLKTISLPRLELCGALLLSRLVNKTVATLNFELDELHYWTDSTIVLAWLGSEPSTLKTLVANRVSEIQSCTRFDNWHHCRSAQNPADIISRGISPNVLADCSLWWEGPTFLKNDELLESESISDVTDLPERRNVALPVTTVNPEWSLLTRYSKFVRLQRVIAWILRFIKTCQGPFDRTVKRRRMPLAARELQESTRMIAKMLQATAFHQEIAQLKKVHRVNNGSSLRSLDPFVDPEGLLRVGGRLRNSPMHGDARHPMLLPHNHHVTRLLIEREHQTQLHAGPQATLNGLRQQFWIINGRSAVRHVTRKCQTCFRVTPKFFHPFMGDLPAVRITPARPFLNTGVDYAGPVNLREGRGRGKRTVKAYIALFVCMCTKAIHLEVVSDATADAFLAAFRRFISRRGKVLNVYSDNGTAFVKANKDLKELQILFRRQNFNEGLHETLSQIGTNWHFIPAHSAHFGGLWEAGVKSVKGHLQKMLGNATNTFEELCTILAQIEACLNSRPLIPLSENPNDLSALSPSHFLIGEPLTAVAEPDLQDVNENRLSRWQQVQRTTQHFWKRWHREYLHQLQQRTKWQRRSSHPFEIGTLVVLQDDNLPPLQWRLGRILELHHGNDGIPRVATVRTTTGNVRRAIVKLAALPTDDHGARQNPTTSAASSPARKN